MGEFAVGAYLRLIEKCNLVSYNQKASELKGEFGEVDAIGIDGRTNTVYLCEVVTHLQGMQYGAGNEDVLRRLRQKFQVIKSYSEQIFPSFKKRFMLWSPYVPRGVLTSGLEEISKELNIDIELIINEEYTARIKKLQAMAREDVKDRGEPFYRALQILEHLR